MLVLYCKSQRQLSIALGNISVAVVLCEASQNGAVLKPAELCGARVSIQFNYHPK